MRECQWNGVEFEGMDELERQQESVEGVWSCAGSRAVDWLAFIHDWLPVPALSCTIIILPGIDFRIYLQFINNNIYETNFRRSAKVSYIECQIENDGENIPPRLVIFDNG